MIGDIGTPPQIVCVLPGLVTWGGLLASDARLRALVPGRGVPRSYAQSPLETL